MRALLLLLALVLPAYAGPVVQVAPISAATPVHPTLLGSFSDPNSPISRNVAFHAAHLLRQADSAAYLRELRYSSPLDRVTSELLSKALYEPAASHAMSINVESLMKAAESVADAEKLFDGSIGTETLEYKKSTLFHEGKKIAPLGKGGFGVVFANPAAEGQVIKMTSLSFDAVVFAGATPKDVHESDVAVTRHLAEHGLGPRLIADTQIGPLNVAVKERIYGPTVQRLIWDRLYGPEQHALVMDLIDRMAAAGVRVGDMNPANIMLGRTLVDPFIRAYHIDGGMVGTVKPGEDEAALRQSIYYQAALFKQRVDHGVGMIETTVALSTMLEEGLRRSAEKGFWQKFKGHLRDAFLNSNIPGK